MRYRDLETGTFLTGDPIGYKDGPNRYCYVHCNPITHFDAFGLEDDDVEVVDDDSMTGDQAAEDTTEQAADNIVNPSTPPLPSFVEPLPTPQYGPTIEAAEALSSSASSTTSQNEQQTQGAQQAQDKLQTTTFAIAGDAQAVGGPSGAIGIAVNEDETVQFFINFGGGFGDNVSVGFESMNGDQAMLTGTSYTTTVGVPLGAAGASAQYAVDGNGNSMKGGSLSMGTTMVLPVTASWVQTEGFATPPIPATTMPTEEQAGWLGAFGSSW